METFENDWLFRLAESELKGGRSVKIRLVGESMRPFLKSESDVLTVEPADKDKLRVGDIIFIKLREDGDYILHRLIKKSDDGILVLKGDANPRGKVERVEDSLLLGTLAKVERGGKEVIDCKNNRFWRLKGLLWMRLSFCRSLLLKILSKVNKPVF